jgi:hypothetical protein
LHLREVDLRGLGRHPITAFVVAPDVPGCGRVRLQMFLVSLAVPL